MEWLPPGHSPLVSGRPTRGEGIDKCGGQRIGVHGVPSLSTPLLSPPRAFCAVRVPVPCPAASATTRPGTPPAPAPTPPEAPTAALTAAPMAAPAPPPSPAPPPPRPVCAPPPTNGDPWADFPGRLLKLQRGLRRRYNSAPPNVFYNTLCPVCPFVLGSKRATTGCFLTRKEFRPPWWVSRPHTLATTKHQSHPLHANQKVRNEPGKKKGSQGSPMVPSA